MKPFDLSKMLHLPELPDYLAQVDAALKRAAASDTQTLHAPIARLLSAGGKRLRPALVIATASMFGQKIDDRVISACTAIELLHISSLVHDDIMDHAATRWNMPTINAAEGVTPAILAGDYLFAKACAEAARVNADATAAVATAFAAICEGQARELADQHNLRRTQASLLRTMDGKTSSLIAASCQLGGMCAGADETAMRALQNFGTNFGRSFQLVDDILDFTGNPAHFGKPVGNDVREGNYTLPLILALQDPRAAEVKAYLKHSPQKLAGLLAAIGTIDASVQTAKVYARTAHDDLQNITARQPANLAALQTLPANYAAWALTALAAK